MEEGNINTKEYWNINYSQGFYQDNSVAEWEFNHIFLKNVLPRTPCRILELACGLGHNAYYVAELGHWVIATDFSEIAIQENNKRFSHNRVRYECVTLEEATTTFKGNDVVMAFEILEHYKDPLPAMFKIAKSLKKNGIFVFTVPNEKGKFAEWCQHYYIFNYTNLTNLLFLAGFKQVRYYKNDFNKERICGVAIK